MTINIMATVKKISEAKIRIIAYIKIITNNPAHPVITVTIKIASQTVIWLVAKRHNAAKRKLCASLAENLVIM